MKRKLSLALLFASFLLMACKDDKNNNQDELLSGTEWTYETRESNSYNEFDVLGNLLKTFPEIRYSLGETVPQTLEKNDTVSLVNETELKFGDNTCTFSASEYYEILFRKRTDYYQYYIFEEQTYAVPSLEKEIKITEDGIYMIQTIQGEPVSQKIFPLSDFATLRFKNQEILSETPNNSVIKDDRETFFYRRDKNTVTLTKDDKEIIGTLDWDASEISLKQILPEEKEWGTLELTPSAN